MDNSIKRICIQRKQKPSYNLRNFIATVGFYSIIRHNFPQHVPNFFSRLGKVMSWPKRRSYFPCNTKLEMQRLEADPNIAYAWIMIDFGLKDECNLIPYIEILSNCNWVRTAKIMTQHRWCTQQRQQYSVILPLINLLSPNQGVRPRDILFSCEK